MGPESPVLSKMGWTQENKYPVSAICGMLTSKRVREKLLAKRNGLGEGDNGDIMKFR